MKLKSLLTLLLIVPFVAMGQSKVSEVAPAKNDTVKADTVKPETRAGGTRAATPNHPVTFFNVGEVYFAAKDDAVNTVTEGIQGETGSQKNQVMFVDGSMETRRLASKWNDNEADIKYYMLMKNNSAIALTGDAINLDFRVSTEDETGFGTVWFTGKVRENATDQSFTLYNEADKKYNLDWSLGDGEKGHLKQKQRIIGFNRLPNVVVDHFSHVSVEYDPTELEASGFTDATGLQIGSKYKRTDPNGPENGIGDNLPGQLALRGGSLFSAKTSYSRTEQRDMYVPLLAVKGAVRTGVADTTITKSGGGTATLKGEMLYDLDLYGGATSNLVAGGANIIDDANIQSEIIRKGKATVMSPFVSPFKSIGGDYMFFNVLTKPSGLNVGGGGEGPIIDPLYSIEGGKAYFIGLDVSDHDKADIEGKWSGVFYVNRSVRGYHFNKHFLNQKAFSKASEATRNNEVFSTLSDIQNIEYKLHKGINFIANPYMAPLNYWDLLIDPDGGNAPNTRTLDEWTTNSANAPIVVDNLSYIDEGDIRNRAIRNRIYFPTKSAVQYFKQASGEDYYFYNVTYAMQSWVGGTVGGTTLDDGLTMAPLTVFAVQAAGDGAIMRIPHTKIELPKPVLYEDDGKTVDVEGELVGPTPKIAKAEIKSERRDEILLQAEIYPLSGKDDVEAKMYSMDGVSVVLRDRATFGFDAANSRDDRFDAEKMFSVYNPSVKYNFNTRAEGGKVTFLDIAKTIPGSLYTVSSDGYALETSAIPTTAKQIPVYFTPTTEKSKVIIQPRRMETLETVQRVWLEDKFLDGENMFEITDGRPYEFISEPVSKELVGQNRFVLHFDFDPDDNGGIIDEELPIIVYYNESSLIIDQLNEKDINSNVEIFDLQGRLVGKTKIKNPPIEKYMHPLAHGVYIVRITGERNYKTKLMVTP